MLPKQILPTLSLVGKERERSLKYYIPVEKKKTLKTMKMLSASFFFYFPYSYVYTIYSYIYTYKFRGKPAKNVSRKF